MPAAIKNLSWSGPWASTNARQAAPAVNSDPATPAVRNWDESSLVQRAQEGDAAAFESLYEDHLGRVYALALRMLRDTRLAEDVTQDIFVRAWEKLASFEGRSSFGTWIHRLGVNVVLGELRTTRRRENRVEPVEDLEMFEGEIKEAMPETKMDLERAIAALPEGAREILILHDIEGYRYREIAEMSEIAEGTVKSQLNRARRLVREALLK